MSGLDFAALHEGPFRGENAKTGVQTFHTAFHINDVSAYWRNIYYEISESFLAAFENPFIHSFFWRFKAS